MSEVELKYSLIAHHIGTDFYVAATEQGSLTACSESMVNYWRSKENLIPFEVIGKNMLAQAEEKRALGLHQNMTVEEIFTRDMITLLNRALIFIGPPPEGQVEFFSIPQEIVSNLHWRS